MKKKGLTKGRIATIITAAVAAVAFIAVLILNIFIPVRYLSAYLVRRQAREDGVLTVTFLDVGYGDCTVIELPDGKVMVIDGGDGTYAHNLYILSYLNSRDIDCIDYLVCSSVKQEHCTGLVDILKYKTVKKVYMPYIKNIYITDAYRAFSSAVTQAELDGRLGTEIACFGVGSAVEESGYFFTFLSPSHYSDSEGAYAALNGSPTTENINNASAVLWLQYGNTSFALASDSGSKTLKNMTEDYTNNLLLGQSYCPIGNYSVNLADCNITTVAAHGYEDCTYAEWYDTLDADIAVLSVGKNYAGCPSQQALADVLNKSTVIRTDDDGAVRIRVTRDGYTVL